MRKLSSKLNVSFITKTFFPDVYAPDINCGDCWMWAYYAWSIYKDVELWDIDCHAFIKYNGKFYDSERPRGVKDWRKLPATEYGNDCDRPRKRTQKTFKKEWGAWCANWKTMDKKAADVIKKHK
jgi:hypothetical protein